MDAIFKQASTLLAALFITTSAHTVFANQDSELSKPVQARDQTQSWMINFSVEQYHFDPEAAYDAYIEKNATALVFEGEYFFSPILLTTVGFGFLQYSDNGGFSQLVSQNGRTKTASSDASAMLLHGEFGYKQFFGGETETYLTARAGMSVFIGSERSIEYCSNCYDENIDINGGLYGLIGAGMKMGETWGLGLAYKSYFSGDVKSTIGLTLTFGY